MKFEKNAETEMIGMSHYYSAPEVNITNKALVSSKSDIFSFGMFLYIIIIYFFLEFYMNLPLEEEHGKIISQKVDRPYKT